MTTARDEHIDDLVDLYALGALEPAEQDVVDEHLRGCERCQALLNESTRVVAALAWVPEQHEPPSDLRTRVMARAQQARPAISAPAPSRMAPPKAWWRQVSGPQEGRIPHLVRQTMGAGALLLILALLGNTVRLQAQLRAIQNQAAAQQQVLQVQLRELQNQAAAQQQVVQGQLHQFQEQVAAQQQLITALRAPGARVVAFSGTGAGSGHSQLLINTTGNQAYLLTDGLPALPADKTYELWLLRDQQPVRSNVFHVDQQGMATIQVQVPTQLKDYQAAAISIEPAGGSTAPTTKPFLLTQF